MNKAHSSSRPLVSVTLPLAPNADPRLLEICLRALADQTYRGFEALILLSPGSSPEVERIADGYTFVRVFEKSLTKSAARNFLARQSAGKYMLYIDVDMELSPTLLEDCIKLALERDSQAIVTDQLEAPRTSFWGKCRALEWDLLSGDIGVSSPYFLLLSTFNKVGGFDESIDLWDDWVLTLRLMAEGIRFDRVHSAILIRDTTDLKEMFDRKYQRGRFIPALLAKYPDAPYVRFLRRFKSIYLANWKVLVRSPVRSLGLAFLKMLDMLALSLGRLDPVKSPPGDGTRLYFQPETASTYDDERLTDGFNLYKHYSELKSLSQLLQPVRGLVIEVGCGTGRITSELTRWGFRILPVDPSPAMLSEFRKKANLPGPIRADGAALPFDANAVEGAFSLRVVWHLPTVARMEQVVREVARVSSTVIVLDISNMGRWRHPLLRPLIALYFRMYSHERSLHETTTLVSLDQFRSTAERLGLQVERVIGIDVVSPVWLKLLPLSVGKSLFPIIERIETAVGRVIPPGRFMIRMRKSPVAHAALSSGDDLEEPFPA